jgi:tellurite resistance protein TerC
VDPDLIGWVVFATVVPTMLALDLLVFNRRPHVLSLREASAWVAVWVSLGLGFGVLVFATRGAVSGTEYLTGYLLEYSLSMDNVFVFAMLFAYFGVPPEHRHRLLYWGVMGAIFFRALFIVGGTLLLQSVHVLIYILGAVLVLTGWRMAVAKGELADPANSRVVRFVRRLLPVTDGYRDRAFIVREGGRLMVTPMFVALVVVETSDIMFAIDSVPAVFAITTDTFIVFTSNAFAILGLRSLYFLLAGLIDKFTYLKVGLGAILVLAGAKMLLSDVVHVPPLLSLALIVGVLALAIGASLLADRRRRRGSAGSTD